MMIERQGNVYEKKILILISIILTVVLLAGVTVTVNWLYRRNIIPHKKYDSSYFNIKQYVSKHDEDNDGINDQMDILKGARKYIDTKPKYKSEYYEETGYPMGEYGVCTDVIAFALRDAGYDLMELVAQDISENPEAYNIETPNKYIDFRRVENLLVYFKCHAESLTTNIYKTEEWQGGDIVVFKGHIGIVSDKRNKDGIPFLLHLADHNHLVSRYEEDTLKAYSETIKITGHFRIS